MSVPGDDQQVRQIDQTLRLVGVAGQAQPTDGAGVARARVSRSKQQQGVGSGRAAPGVNGEAVGADRPAAGEQGGGTLAGDAQEEPLKRVAQDAGGRRAREIAMSREGDDWAMRRLAQGREQSPHRWFRLDSGQALPIISHCTQRWRRLSLTPAVSPTAAAGDSFALPPLIFAAWMGLEPAELALAESLLRRALTTNGEADPFIGRPRAGRALPLPFYGEDWHLVDLEGETKAGPAAVALVVGPEGAELVDGGAGHVHARNMRLGPLKLVEDADVLLYLKMFCGCVWGDEGAFSLVETPAEALSLIEAPVLDVEPPSVERQGLGARIDAQVVYAGDLFRSSFEVRPSGLVTMLDDEPVLSGAARLDYRRPFRLRGLRVVEGGDGPTE